jgi:hypothetical protein
MKSRYEFVSLWQALSGNLRLFCLQDRQSNYFRKLANILWNCSSEINTNSIRTAVSCYKHGTFIEYCEIHNSTPPIRNLKTHSFLLIYTFPYKLDNERVVERDFEAAKGDDATLFEFPLCFKPQATCYVKFTVHTIEL